MRNTVSFEALGVPRNQEIVANGNPDYYDMGLCGPLRQDQAGQSKLCGLFKTPTLRNVATRGVFFHNGRFHTLICCCPAVMQSRRSSIRRGGRRRLCVVGVFLRSAWR
jgi:cytochrome c peroxidase